MAFQSRLKSIILGVIIRCSIRDQFQNWLIITLTLALTTKSIFLPKALQTRYKKQTNTLQLQAFNIAVSILIAFLYLLSVIRKVLPQSQSGYKADCIFTKKSSFLYLHDFFIFNIFSIYHVSAIFDLKEFTHSGLVFQILLFE